MRIWDIWDIWEMEWMQVCAKLKKSLGEGCQAGTKRGASGEYEKGSLNITVASLYTCLTKTCAGQCCLSCFIKSFLN